LDSVTFSLCVTADLACRLSERVRFCATPTSGAGWWWVGWWTAAHNLLLGGQRRRLCEAFLEKELQFRFQGRISIENKKED
jgi:hypothetical protein